MKLIEAGLVALAGTAVVIGAYQAGRQSERAWWRQELASRNGEVAATMSRLGAEADNLDQQVLRIIEGDRAKLEDAESQIRTINTRPPAPADAGGECRPVPAHCLRRGGAGRRAEAPSSAAGGGGAAR